MPLSRIVRSLQQQMLREISREVASTKGKKNPEGQSVLLELVMASSLFIVKTRQNQIVVAIEKGQNDKKGRKDKGGKEL